ncbi:CTLH/CRA C-terminal to lish motif domain-containing protein [Dichotomocladium elegans]|nr:CTLH/CRA C-terminal to lish motif domain-containing protein [Dichotomocladium elegans]
MDSDLQEICRTLVTEYLVHHCFKNTAKAFLYEAKKMTTCSDIAAGGASSNGTSKHNANSMDIDDCDITRNVTDTTNDEVLKGYTWSLLDARKGLYDAILSGDIPQAFILIHRHFPALAAYDKQDPMIVEPTDIHSFGNSCTSDDDFTHLEYIVFKLKCQQFIEIVRTSNEVEAIVFAQTHLKSRHKEYRELTNEVASLIAYPDPHNASCSHLLSQERRRLLADEVNKVVLRLSNLRYETALERIHKHAELLAAENAANISDSPTEY